jgi:hypothetical protein
MRKWFEIAAAITLLGCGSSGGDGGSEKQDTAVLTEPAVAVDDTAVRTDDMGHVMLVTRTADGVRTRELFGLFVDFHEDYLNLARCAVDRSTCYNVVPGEKDQFIDLEPRNEFPFDREFRYLGIDIGLGPYDAYYFYDSPSGSAYYYGDVTDTKPIYGPAGVRFGVEWGDYAGTEDITLNAPIEVVSPPNGSPLKFKNGENITFEWTPTGAGEVYLRISSFNYERIFWLADDGYHDLSIDSLGYGDMNQVVTFTLSRWHTDVVRHENNALEISDVSEVAWTGRYIYKGSREELEPADSCLEAQGMTAITDSGTYWGRLGGYRSDLDPGVGNPCTGFNAPGNEGMVAVDLDPLEIMTVNYRLEIGDASVYVVEDCSDASMCLAGADATLLGDLESFQYFNNTEATQRLYLVLDAYQNQSGGRALGTFELDLTIDQLLEPDMHDSCPDAQMQLEASGPGTYYTEYLPYTNQLNPGPGGCTASSMSGPESMTKVTLQPGETLVATVTMPGGDPGLYLLYNCTNPFSCPVGADARGDAVEAIGYINNTTVSETLYLVVDTKFGMLPYFLTVDIE